MSKGDQMKFTLLKVIFTSGLLPLSTLSSAGIINSADYELTNIDGSFTWGNTNWNLAGSKGYVDNTADLSEIDTLLSDGYEFSSGNTGKVNGIYNWSTFGYHAFTYNFVETTTFSGLDLLISRNYSLLTPFFAEVFDGNNWTTLVSGTTGDLGLTLSIMNNQATTQNVSVDFGSVTGNAIRFGYNNGSQIALHEVTFNGNVSTTSVPEPSTFAIFALGMIGLASRRYKKAL